MTARWVVDEVLPERDLHITWQPISLLEKNQPPPDSEYYAASLQTHKYLRVMEAIRASGEADGDVRDPVFEFYWELGRRIHHDKELHVDLPDVLSTIGVDTALAGAFDDETWDAEIKTRMAAGLALTGDDVGTPLIAFDDVNGQRIGLFGPVITRVPDRRDSLQLWDAFVTLGRIPGFWEVKRTRTEPPDFGPRP